MFGSRSKRNHDQALALVGLLGSIASSCSGKGRGAERMEALAQVVAALGISPESIQSIEIDWKSVRVGGTEELVPVLRMVSVDGSQKEIQQIDRDPESALERINN